MKAALFALLFACLCSVPAQAQSYLGDLVLKSLPDGRRMELLQDFGFVDALERKWVVPKGWVVDGASIPQPLWAFVGGPFSGKYRDASVIHDYFCDVRRRPWDEVHQLFYDAMRVSGVSPLKAKLMYLAVYRFGPRWDFALPTCPPGAFCEVFGVTTIDEFQPQFDQEEFDALKSLIEQDPTVAIRDIKKELDRSFLEDAFWNTRR